MSTPAPLPLDLAAPGRRVKPRRANAGERNKDRVTSFKMQPEDELVLDALRAEYGTHLVGAAIRRALREAAEVHGIDIEQLRGETAAA